MYNEAIIGGVPGADPCGMCGARAVEGAIAEMETTTSRREFLALLRKGYVDAIASHKETMRLLDVDKLYAMMRKCLK